MITLRPLRVVRLGLGLFLGSLLASSCVVDKSGLTFDDDLFYGEGGAGGETPGSGGQQLGSGGLGGLGGLGGAVGSGGLGGSGNLCEPNAMQCDGKQVQLCANDVWIPIGGPCPNACVDGACTGMCSPGTDECLSSIQTQHCNEVGEWEADFCEFACVGGTCGGVCRPGDRGCDADSPTLCGEDGQFTAEDPCPGTCEAGVCVGACVLGDTQCGGDAENPVQITCDAPNWEDSTETACEFICEQETGECGGECAPFTSTCASGTSVQVCDSTAHYGPAEDCTYICVEETGNCGGNCLPGSQQCSGDTIQTCDAEGNWRDGDTCTGEKPVCLDPLGEEAPACVQCAPGAEMCSPFANQVLTCSEAGSWPKEGQECPTEKGAICWKGACEKSTEICPNTCLKVGCPQGCIDPSTQWYCTAIGGDLKVNSCASGTSCNAGDCE